VNEFHKAKTKKEYINAILFFLRSFRIKSKGTKAPKIRKGKPEGGHDITNKKAEKRQSMRLRNIFCIIAKQISYFLSIYKHIPNLITLGNLLFGIIAILLAFGGNLTSASFCIICSALLDFLDGLLARFLKVNSNLGKQLDSLSDLISFGLAPSVIVFQMLYHIESGAFFKTASGNIEEYTVYFWPYIAFLIPLFSAYRLAKFNIDNRQSDFFIGLPTPANALFFVSLPFILKYDDGIICNFLYKKEVIIVVIVVFCILMISELKLISFKFNSFQWPANKYRYTLIITSLVLLLLLGFEAIPIILILYIVLSIINK